MKTKRPLLISVALLSLFGHAAFAGNNTITPKLGSFSISDKNQTVLGSNLTFTEDSESEFAVEYQWRYENGLSIGGELISYTNKFTLASGAGYGELDTAMILFNVKYRFNVTNWFRPFIGASIGFAGVDASGNIIEGDGADMATGLSAGFEFPFSTHIGLTAEYRTLNSEPEDDNGESFDVSGSGAFVGLNVYF